MTLTVISAIYGGYDQPKPVLADCPHVLVTDNPNLHAPGWKHLYCPLPTISTPMLRAKYVKTHPAEFIDTPISVWLDGSITVTAPDFTERCLQALADRDLALTPHPWRDCIYDEAIASCGIGRYPETLIAEQARRYLDRGHPKHWGLFATGAIVRRTSVAVLELGDAWWQENLTRTWQDQLSLPVLLRERPDLRWEANLPWEQWWTISGRAWG